MLFHFPHLVAVLKSEKARDYDKEYREYHGTPAQIKARADRNAARRKLGIPKGDPREADHKNPISNGGSNSTRNLRAVSRSTNRKKGASVKKDGDWEEGKHPRADNGQFGSGGGSSSASKPASKKPSKTKRKLDRRAAEAGQGKVTGAIQSLLTGGSALDNVKWFKQPESATKPIPATLDGIRAALKENAAAQQTAQGAYHSADPNSPGLGALAERHKTLAREGDRLKAAFLEVKRTTSSEAKPAEEKKPAAKPAPAKPTEQAPAHAQAKPKTEAHSDIAGYNLPLAWPKNGKPEVGHPMNPKTGGRLKDVWVAWDNKGKPLGRFKSQQDAETAFNDWYKSSGYELQEKTERANDPVRYYFGGNTRITDMGVELVSIGDSRYGQSVTDQIKPDMSVEDIHNMHKRMTVELNRKIKETKNRFAAERWSEQS